MVYLPGLKVPVVPRSYTVGSNFPRSPNSCRTNAFEDPTKIAMSRMSKTSSIALLPSSEEQSTRVAVSEKCQLDMREFSDRECQRERYRRSLQRFEYLCDQLV
jgi:hypothetical protein